MAIEDGAIHDFNGLDWHPIFAGLPLLSLTGTPPIWRTADEVFILAGPTMLHGTRRP